MMYMYIHTCAIYTWLCTCVPAARSLYLHCDSAITRRCRNRCTIHQEGHSWQWITTDFTRQEEGRGVRVQEPDDFLIQLCLKLYWSCVCVCVSVCVHASSLAICRVQYAMQLLQCVHHCHVAVIQSTTMQSCTWRMCMITSQGPFPHSV